MGEEVRIEPIRSLDLNWGGQLLNVEEAWQKTKGRGVLVAVMDTGVDKAHPDLKGKLWGRRTWTGEKTDGNGHGTWVAGQVVADGKVTGVAPDAKAVDYQVLGSNGSGSISALCEALRAAVDDGCRVANMSLGLDADVPKFRNAIQHAHKKGLVMVAAAGNDSNRLDYPARYPEVIAVGAVDRNLDRAPFSDMGPGLVVVAPGVALLGLGLKGGYQVISGTSMATPFVSGVVALMLSAHPEYTFADVVRKLSETANDLGAPGRDNETGWGMVNPPEAVAWQMINDVGMA